MKSSILLNLDFQTIETIFFHHISAFPSQQSCVCNVLLFVFFFLFIYFFLFNFLLGYGYSHFFP